MSVKSTECPSCGCPMEYGGRCRVQLQFERLVDGRILQHRSMSGIVCKNCADEIAEMLSRKEDDDER